MNYKKQIDGKGLKISWLAKQIGVSQPLLSMYISGKRNMSYETEKKLQEYLT